MADSSWMYQPSYDPGNAADDQQREAYRRRTDDPGSSHSLSALRIAQLQNDLAVTEHKLSANTRIRRRNRQITSCLECRRRKLKCDKQAPCTNCTRFKRDCLYLAPATDPHSQQRLAEMKEKMGALEKNLEREIASTSGRAHLGGTSIRPTHLDSQTHVDAGDEEDTIQDEEALEPTPLAALDNVYDDNVDDELMDLGVQMGKMRISERIGGWIRPKLVEELNDTLHDVTGEDESPQGIGSDSRASSHKIQASPKSYIGPGPDYIAPASSFFFPGTNMSTTLLDYLPSKNAADLLVARYFQAVHPIARAVHRPTFEAQYSVFWASIASGTEPAPSIQAIMFAGMFNAAVSMTDQMVSQRFGTSKAALIDSLRSGSEMALSKANFLRTTRVDTMQAFVLYLIPLVRSEVSRAHSALVGTAIRLAECMGLHRDGSHYSMTAVEIHVRRLIWHQLCFLDMRACEATGPRPQIRRDDYDTQFPLNVDDQDLLDDLHPPKEDKPHWTDMTLFRIRVELSELRRSLWFDIVQIDRKKKTLTSTLVKIQKTRQSILSKYGPMIDESVPVKLLAKYVMEIEMSGWFIQALHRYLFSTSQPMPDRLRQLLIDSGLNQMEKSIALETKPELAPWYWYRGALNQYHVALLLMVEVYAYPMRKDAARVWKCLDYIFDIPPHLSPKPKAELVITDLRDRMEVYHQMRKLRVTTQMEERVTSMSRSALSPPLKQEAQSSAASSSQSSSQRQQIPVDSSHIGSVLSTAQWGVTPQQFSPPPPAAMSHTEGSRESRQSSVPTGVDTAMTMDDIDWAEWDKFFPIDQGYTGELNNPDFDIAHYTSQGFHTNNRGGSGGVGVPSDQDLAGVNFGGPATFFTDPGANRALPASGSGGVGQGSVYQP